MSDLVINFCFRLLFAAVLALSCAAPQDAAPVQIVEQEQEVNGDGSYQFS